VIAAPSFPPVFSFFLTRELQQACPPGHPCPAPGGRSRPAGVRRVSAGRRHPVRPRCLAGCGGTGSGEAGARSAGIQARCKPVAPIGRHQSARGRRASIEQRAGRFRRRVVPGTSLLAS